MGEQQAEGGLADAPSQLNASEASSGSASIDALAESSRPLHSEGEEPFFAEELPRRTNQRKVSSSPSRLPLK